MLPKEDINMLTKERKKKSFQKKKEKYYYYCKLFLGQDKIPISKLQIQNKFESLKIGI